jgi:prepilin-type N-terminal cleavage/methylation domain-containing protein
MSAPKRTPRRSAFTLIELLVALAIILTLAALGYMLAPSMFGNYRRVSNVDQVSQWLLTARQRARRDGRPTGLRLLPATDDAGKVIVNADGSVFVRQVQYVQQPESLVGGRQTKDGLTGGLCAEVSRGVVTFRNVDFVGGGSTADEYLVQPGDYLELHGGGNVHRIAAVTRDQLFLSDDKLDLPRFKPTTNYRILRQPRPLLGEKVLDLPSDMVIDLGPPASVDKATGNPLSFQTANPTRSVNVPERLAGGGKSPPKLVLEVVFSPNGAVLSGKSGKVILWLRDGSATASAPAPPVLVAIPVGTGFIAACDVAPGADPYLYTENGRDSGL